MNKCYKEYWVYTDEVSLHILSHPGYIHVVALYIKLLKAVFWARTRFYHDVCYVMNYSTCIPVYLKCKSFISAKYDTTDCEISVN